MEAALFLFRIFPETGKKINNVFFLFLQSTDTYFFFPSENSSAHIKYFSIISISEAFHFLYKRSTYFVYGVCLSYWEKNTQQILPLKKAEWCGRAMPAVTSE